MLQSECTLRVNHSRLPATTASAKVPAIKEDVGGLARGRPFNGISSSLACEEHFDNLRGSMAANVRARPALAAEHPLGA